MFCSLYGNLIVMQLLNIKNLLTIYTLFIIIFMLKKGSSLRRICDVCSVVITGNPVGTILIFSYYETFIAQAVKVFFVKE